MDILNADNVKHRLIPFSALHPDKNQAHTASLFLSSLEGILRAEPVSALVVRVSYDVLQTTLLEIEDLLGNLGLHLDRNLMYRLKSALCHYTEETQRANCGCPRGESNCRKKIFASRYGKLDHTCRDHRPEHWRKYL
jgi:hypothetical protein